MNEKIVAWCKENYGSDNLGNVKVLRVGIDNYLSMIMDFTQEVALDTDMKYYIKETLDEFP